MSNQNEHNSLWTEKYRPKTLNEYYIFKHQLDTVNEWITDLKNKNKNNNIIKIIIIVKRKILNLF